MFRIGTQQLSKNTQESDILVPESIELVLKTYSPS